MIIAAAILAAATPGNDRCALHLVSSTPGENHVMFHGVSPDGRRLAIGWDKGEGPNVQRGAFLLDLRSGKRSALPHLNNAASFSPDGRNLVSANYAGRDLKTEVVELDQATGQSKTYASGPSLEWLASYSHDGKWILFNSTRSGGSDLYRANRADGHLERLTSDPRYEAHAQFFDGDRRLIFHRQTEGDNYDVVIRDIASGTEVLVGATPAEESYPAMSPDGRWVVFSAVTELSTQPHLFVMRADGSDRRQLTSGIAKDAYATWAPDGRTIYFVRFAAGGSKIFRLSVRNGHCTR